MTEPIATLDSQDLAERLDVLLSRGSERWPRWMSKPIASAYSSLSVRSIERLIANGTLTPSRLIKGKLLIDRLELDDAIMAARSVRGGRG